MLSASLEAEELARQMERIDLSSTIGHELRASDRSRENMVEGCGGIALPKNLLMSHVRWHLPRRRKGGSFGGESGNLDRMHDVASGKDEPNPTAVASVSA